MKVRWREHEMILVTAIAVITLSGYLWNLSSQQYGSPFINSGVPFSLYKNVLLPDISLGLAAYLAYLWFSLYTIPRLLFPKKVEIGMSRMSVTLSKISFEGLAKKAMKEYAWLFIQIALVIVVVGCIGNVATYYRHQWQFGYPGFSIFFNSKNPRSQMDLGEPFFAVASIIAVYGVYVFIREAIIHFILSLKQKLYAVSICNKITLMLTVFFILLSFLQTFNLLHEQSPDYILIIAGLFAMFISNVYWLFPLKGEASFFSRKIIIRLLSTSFVYAIPLTALVHEQGAVAFIYSWALQLFVVTPITWWYFQSNKEKILQLRVVETALVKSKADLHFLRSQINPHFLFNVLNTLYGTALQEGAERTSEGIQKLGDMMRFMLHENNLDFIDMSKEIEYLKNYISLQKLRTQSSPDIIIEDNISDQNYHHKIAPMLLIPLIENAFKHGISLKEKSWIKMNLTCDKTELFFEVRNSMHAKQDNDPEKERSGIGFKNVLERLKLIYPNRHKISVNGDGKEFFVQLSIQL